MMPPPRATTKNVTATRRGSTGGALPRTPSNGTPPTSQQLQSLLKPTSRNDDNYADSLARQASITRRRNSLSDFFDHALNFLPAGDAYASLPCYTNMMGADRQQQQQQQLGGSGNVPGNNFRATSIGTFAKDDMLYPCNITPNVVFSSDGVPLPPKPLQAHFITAAANQSMAVTSTGSANHHHHQQHNQQYHQTQDSNNYQQQHHSEMMAPPPPPLTEIQMTNEDYYYDNHYHLVLGNNDDLNMNSDSNSDLNLSMNLNLNLDQLLQSPLEDDGTHDDDAEFGATVTPPFDDDGNDDNHHHHHHTILHSQEPPQQVFY
jgi:hypothetical protein